MNYNALKISGNLVPANYLKLAIDAQKAKETKARELLEKRSLPVIGWSDDHIEELVHFLAALDSNNFSSKSGLGEREARIACNLVARRHYNFGHGIGRSGNLLEPQPKAAGSTLLANLVNALLVQLVHAMGVRSCKICFLVPMATGMTLNLCLQALKKQRPNAKYVIWSRIDQKSCFKSITTAGLIPIIVDQKPTDGAPAGVLSTDIKTLENKIAELNSCEILCLFSTTSCFAPRSCDNIIELAKLAAQHQLPHLVNNAYGLQSTYQMHQLEEAQRLGRVDLFVQSTDKNLMVPVGGAIVAGFNEDTVRNVAMAYAGRASSSQSLDVLMTLLSLGKSGFMHYVEERKKNYKYMRDKLLQFAEQHNEMIFDGNNSISIALTLKSLQKGEEGEQDISKFGSMLYTRGISGVRVLNSGDNRDIDGYTFQNWGTHNSQYSLPYLTVASTLGQTRNEIDTFLKKLHNCWRLFLSRV